MVTLSSEQRAIAREMERTIGCLLREERDKQGRPQTEVAAALGISASVLSRLETGRRGTGQPALRVLHLCAVLGVDLCDIVHAAKHRVQPTTDAGPACDRP
jgi:transcriptional regulator with XRE-family HTH domain